MPIPQIKTIFDRISGATWFSLMDLKSGYYQCTLHKDSREYTSFSTSNNKYMFKCLPFGLRNAVGHFCRIINMVLGNLPFIQTYLDDFVIFSDTFEQHCEHIETVFKALAKAGLKVNAEKCTWFAKEIKLLGHIVSGKTLKMDPEKVKAMLERRPPTNVKEVQIFLGCSGYYRSLIKDYAHIAKPLFDLIKKDTIFVMDVEQMEAFETLKKRLS